MLNINTCDQLRKLMLDRESGRNVIMKAEGIKDGLDYEIDKIGGTYSLVKKTQTGKYVKIYEGYNLPHLYNKIQGLVKNFNKVQDLKTEELTSAKAAREFVKHNNSTANIIDTFRAGKYLVARKVKDGDAEYTINVDKVNKLAGDKEAALEWLNKRIKLLERLIESRSEHITELGSLLYAIEQSEEEMPSEPFFASICDTKHTNIGNGAKDFPCFKMTKEFPAKERIYIDSNNKALRKASSDYAFLLNSGLENLVMKAAEKAELIKTLKKLFGFTTVKIVEVNDFYGLDRVFIHCIATIEMDKTERK